MFTFLYAIHPTIYYGMKLAAEFRHAAVGMPEGPHRFLMDLVYPI